MSRLAPSAQRVKEDVILNFIPNCTDSQSVLCITSIMFGDKVGKIYNLTLLGLPTLGMLMEYVRSKFMEWAKFQLEKSTSVCEFRV